MKERVEPFWTFVVREICSLWQESATCSRIIWASVRLTEVRISVERLRCGTDLPAEIDSTTSNGRGQKLGCRTGDGGFGLDEDDLDDQLGRDAHAGDRVGVSRTAEEARVGLKEGPESASA